MGVAVLKSSNSRENRLSVKKQNRTLKSQKRRQQFVHFRALRNTVPWSQAFVQVKAFFFQPSLTFTARFIIHAFCLPHTQMLQEWADWA